MIFRYATNLFLMLIHGKRNTISRFLRFDVRCYRRGPADNWQSTIRPFHETRFDERNEATTRKRYLLVILQGIGDLGEGIYIYIILRALWRVSPVDDEIQHRHRRWKCTAKPKCPPVFNERLASTLKRNRILFPVNIRVIKAPRLTAPSTRTERRSLRYRFAQGPPSIFFVYRYLNVRAQLYNQIILLLHHFFSKANES